MLGKCLFVLFCFALFLFFFLVLFRFFCFCFFALLSYSDKRFIVILREVAFFAALIDVPRISSFWISK